MRRRRRRVRAALSLAGTAALAAAVAAAAAALAAAGAASAQSAADGPSLSAMPAPDGAAVLDIGVLLPLTGDLHGLGAWMDAAVDKSAADLNERLARDGAGWSVRLTKADTGTDPATALEAARAMRGGGIALVVGPAASANVDAVRGLAGGGDNGDNGDGMVVVSCCSSASFLSVPGDSIFRLAPNNTAVASFAAGRMLEAGAGGAVVAYRGDAWGEDLYSAAAVEFDAAAGAGSARGVRYDPGADPGLIAAEIAARLAEIGGPGAGSDGSSSGGTAAAVLLVGFEETAGILAAAGRMAAVDPAVPSQLEAAAWLGINVYDEIVRNAEAAAFAEAVGYGGILAGPDAAHPLFAGVRDHAIAAVSPGAPRADPDVFTSYDAVQILAMAASAAGTADAAAVAEAVPAAAESYRGLSGDTSLNAAGDRNSAIFEVWTVRDGRWEGRGGGEVAAGETPPGAAKGGGGGGCLVATAAYGTEMAPGVQALRELREVVLASGTAGPSLASAFHAVYYSLSPHAADLMREHPLLMEAVGAVAVAPAVHALRAAQLAAGGGGGGPSASMSEPSP